MPEIKASTVSVESPDLLASALYEGEVRHRRFEPRSHEFKYNVFMVCLDLQELDVVFGQSRWWSLEKLNFFTFRRSDFFDRKPDKPLYDSVADWVETEVGRRPQGPIRMLANLRCFGYIINPITCYYCYDLTGENVETVVAEVTNTPWGEKQLYALPFDLQNSSNNQKLEYEFKKAMHVSPFQPMDLIYRWRGKKPADLLSIHIDVCKSSKPVFDATLLLEKQPMLTQAMNRMVLRYPLMTVKVFASIYWEALRLAIKRIPFYSNPGDKPTANKKTRRFWSKA